MEEEKALTPFPIPSWHDQHFASYEEILETYNNDPNAALLALNRYCCLLEDVVESVAGKHTVELLRQEIKDRAHAELHSGTEG